MNGQQIINLFDTLTDGLSELSAANKLELANRKYRKLVNERDWEDIRTTATYTIASNAIVLASDFKKFVPAEEGQYAEYKNVFYIGTTPHPILRMAERKKFPNFSYFNPSLGTNGHIITPTSLNGQLAEYDYYKSVSPLTVSTSPVFTNSDYHEIIAYMMAVEHYSIDQSEFHRSQSNKYQETVDSMLEDMEYDDNQLKESALNHA